MKDKVDTLHGMVCTGGVPDIANVKLEFGRFVSLAHVVLLLFIATKYAYLCDVRVKEASHDGIAKRPSATSDQQCL